MRVNVDSQALRDPRMRLLARHAAIPEAHALGLCLHVWMVCYERKTACLQAIEIDLVTDRDGFATAMIGASLAEQVSDGLVYVKGVTERIEFLEAQAHRGRLSAEARKSKELNGRSTKAQPMAEPAQQRLFNRRSSERSTKSGSTNSLAPDLTLSPDQAPDHIGETSGDRVSVDSTADTPQAHGEPPHASEKPKSGKAAPELPEVAYTLAWQLLNSIRENHPGGRLAKLPDRMQAVTAERWAETIDKLHRIDGMDFGVIGGMIAWCQRDSFWKGVILGADNLRDKWDKIAAQRNRGAPPGPQQQQRKGPTAMALEEQRELERIEREQEQAT